MFERLRLVYNDNLMIYLTLYSIRYSFYDYRDNFVLLHNVFKAFLLKKWSFLSAE